MKFISPLTEDEKRRRESGEVLEDGEHLRFDLSFRDSAPASILLTDNQSDPHRSARVLRDVAQAARYGDGAAALKLRELTQDAEQKYQTAADAKRDELRNAWRNEPTDVADRAVRDHIRSNQYGG